MLPSEIKEMFAAWFETRPESVQSDLSQKWDALANDPSIAHGHRNAEYARRTMLLKYARDKHGYNIEW